MVTAASEEPVGLAFAERIARGQRIGGDVDDLGVLARLVVARHPWHHALDDDHHVGLRQQRAGIVAEMHGMVGRQVHVARFGLHHRQRELLGECRQRAHRLRHPAAARGDDERKLGLGDELCRLLDCGARWLGRERAERANGVAARLGAGGGEHLARQRQIDRSARLAHGDVECTIDHRFHRLPAAQLVVPFHVFAQHAALVERLLPPVDRPVARGDAAGFGERCTAGGEQQRNIVARGVDDAVDRIGGADGDVHHHRRRLAGDAVVAVRHGHRHVLVRHRHEARNFRVLRLGQRLHDGGEIGPGIGEHVFDAAGAQPGDIGLGRHAVGGLAVSHCRTHSRGTKRRKVAVRPGSVNESHPRHCPPAF
jgi:hypothetical protein